MLTKFFPGKLARFAVLMLLVFLLAQSGVARAQEETPDVQVAREILFEAARQMGYIYEGEVDVFGDQSHYYMGLSVENGPALFVDIFPTEAAARQFIDDILLRQGTAMTFHDHPGLISATGPYEDGHYLYSLTWAMQNFGFHCQATDGNPPACAEVLYAVASQRLGQETSVEPDPYIDPNPNPNPDPAPSPIDPQVISILQSILSTPALPITGAIAGGLVAWVISMLGGGRTVLPIPPRPPTGGFRPGQVGPDGKIWSPGQGWVSKSTYDYQQKWLQKGWRLNPQTNKLEVQPGAVNDSGQVWYKLPYDEGNSHYWVDKAKVQEYERNMAEGLVYDHGLSGWIKPNDLADFNRSKQDFYDNVSSPEARQRDHERLMNQEVAPDAQYQKIANDIKQMEDELNKWRSDSIKGDMESEQRKSQRQSERAETMDRWSNRAGMVETGADVFISVAATLTGPVGKSIEEGYNTIKRTALALDTGIAQKSIKAGVLDYGESYIKDKVVDKVSSALSADTLSPVPGKVFKKFVAGTGKPGIKAFSKTGLKAVKGIGAVVDYGKGKLVEEGYDELGEYLGQVVQPGPGS